MSVKTQREQIKEELDFYIKNPTLGAQFKHTIIAEGNSNLASKGSQPISRSTIEPFIDLTIDNENVTIVYNGQDDIHKPKVFDKDGNWKKGVDQQTLWITNGNITIRAEDQPSKRLLEFLLTISICYPTTFNKRSPIEHIRVEETFVNPKVYNPMTGYELAKLIELLGTTKAGQEFLLKKASLSNVYPNYENVTAMQERGGMQLIIIELQKEALTNTAKFAKAFKGYETQDSIVDAAIDKKIIGYNKKSSSYQFLDSKGEFEKDLIIFPIKEENETISRLLLSDHLFENKEKLNDINFRLTDAATNS